MVVLEPLLSHFEPSSLRAEVSQPAELRAVKVPALAHGVSPLARRFPADEERASRLSSGLARRDYPLRHLFEFAEGAKMKEIPSVSSPVDNKASSERTLLS